MRLRRGELAAAMVDYDAAVRGNPRSAWSLYARGITAGRIGNAPGAAADRKAAVAMDGRIAEQAKRLGLE